eukprot:Gb_39458 [translate_table: standard]
MAGSVLQIIEGERSKKEQIGRESKGFVPSTSGKLRTRDLLGMVGSSEIDLNLNLGRNSEGLNYVNVISDEDNEEREERKVRRSIEPVRGQWQSACTVERVKMALKRAHKQTLNTLSKQRHQRSPDRALSFSSAHEERAKQLIWKKEGEKRKELGSASPLFAAGCSRCLLYLLLPNANSRCPRCGSFTLNYFNNSSSNNNNKKNKRARFNGVGDSQESTPSPISSSIHTLIDLNVEAI